GPATTYYVEYADNPSFTGSTSLPATQDASAGSGFGELGASKLATGLSPDTTSTTGLLPTTRSATAPPTSSPSTPFPLPELRRAAPTRRSAAVHRPSSPTAAHTNSSPRPTQAASSLRQRHCRRRFAIRLPQAGTPSLSPLSAKTCLDSRATGSSISIRRRAARAVGS